MVVDGYEMTESHSEAEIYRGCIALMQELMGRFEDYLDFIGVDPGQMEEEERFATSFYPMHIVERLLLFGTNHSGGTSQSLKCDELSIDTGNAVVFEDNRGKENE